MTLDINVILAAVVVILLALFIGYFVFLIRHQEAVEPKEPRVEGVELLRQHYAPGATVEQPTPYFVAPIPAAPDPLEISANLDKKIVLGALMIFGSFAIVGAYFVFLFFARADASSNTWRDRVAEEKQTAQLAHRGKNLYANLCFDCHGKAGKGDVGVGLPLNKPDFKYENVKDNPAKLKEVDELLTKTIARGRPRPGGISMPAWSADEGGSLNAEQIRQLVTFIERGTDEDWGDVVQVRVNSGLDAEPNPPTVKAATPADHGKAVASTVCVRCHSFDAGQTSPFPQSPNLARYGADGPLAAENKAAKAKDPQGWLAKWITNPPSVKPGTLMPPYGKSAGGQLSDDEIKDVIVYLEGLGK